MPVNSQALFANLAERERIHGHHSPEGEAIRLLSRALDGWASANLGGTDVVLLCAQAVEDWLKRRLHRSPWSIQSLPELLSSASATALLSPSEVGELQKLAAMRQRTDALTPVEIEDIMTTTIAIVERRWS